MRKRHLSLIVMDLSFNQDILYGLGCGINFKLKQDTLLEDNALIQLPQYLMILQPLSPYLM